MHTHTLLSSLSTLTFQLHLLASSKTWVRQVVLNPLFWNQNVYQMTHGKAYFHTRVHLMVLGCSNDTWKLIWGLMSSFWGLSPWYFYHRDIPHSSTCMWCTQPTSPFALIKWTSLEKLQRRKCCYIISQGIRVPESVHGKGFNLAVRSYIIGKELEKWRLRKGVGRIENEPVTSQTISSENLKGNTGKDYGECWLYTASISVGPQTGVWWWAWVCCCSAGSVVKKKGWMRSRWEWKQHETHWAILHLSITPSGY